MKALRGETEQLINTWSELQQEFHAINKSLKELRGAISGRIGMDSDGSGD